jgi:predicted MFS family arabinose efflux permease
VAVVLFVEAFGVAALNWFMGVVVDRQDMSLAGLDSDTMATSSKVGGVLFGLYYALCGLVALLVALRNRPPAGFGRILLISAAVVHGLLGAFVWGLVGWPAFLFMIVVLALIVLLLMSYDSPEERTAAPAADAPGPEDGKGPENSPEGGKGDESSPVTPPPAPTAP